MKTLMMIAISIAMGACVAATTSQDTTGSTEQDITGRTCTGVVDYGSGYLGCEVNDRGGPYFLMTGVSSADCAVCGTVVSDALCVQVPTPPDPVYCAGPHHGPGGVGGPPAGGPGKTCGAGCYQRASGDCDCGGPQLN